MTKWKKEPCSSLKSAISDSLPTNQLPNTRWQLNTCGPPTRRTCSAWSQCFLEFSFSTAGWVRTLGAPSLGTHLQQQPRGRTSGWAHTVSHSPSPSSLSPKIFSAGLSGPSAFSMYSAGGHVLMPCCLQCSEDAVLPSRPCYSLWHGFKPQLSCWTPSTCPFSKVLHAFTPWWWDENKGRLPSVTDSSASLSARMRQLPRAGRASRCRAWLRQGTHSSSSVCSAISRAITPRINKSLQAISVLNWWT